ncbi:hypothetical protein X773_04285 [Mesorhizobium sp. LSJC285A00]|nr:hypothetical protein X773_04285 [Mesorhizobium sp. LSJC285A00]
MRSKRSMPNSVLASKSVASPRASTMRPDRPSRPIALPAVSSISAEMSRP